jgi:hypothetical protein
MWDFQPIGRGSPPACEPCVTPLLKLDFSGVSRVAGSSRRAGAAQPVIYEPKVHKYSPPHGHHNADSHGRYSMRAAAVGW